MVEAIVVETVVIPVLVTVFDGGIVVVSVVGMTTTVVTDETIVLTD